MKYIIAIMPFVLVAQGAFAAGKPAAAHSPEKLSGAGEVSKSVVPMSISADQQVNLMIQLKVLQLRFASKK